MELFQSPDLNPLDFCLWVWMKSDVYKMNVDTPDELVSRNMDAAASIMNMKINSDEQNAIFEHELQNAVRMKVVLSNTYCELYEIFHFCVIDLSFVH